MKDLKEMLHSRLRGPNHVKEINYDNIPRQILSMILMAEAGGNVVHVSLHSNRAWALCRSASQICEKLLIPHQCRNPSLAIRFKSSGRIIFTTADAHPENFKGAELTGVFINEAP